MAQMPCSECTACSTLTLQGTAAQTYKPNNSQTYWASLLTTGKPAQHYCMTADSSFLTESPNQGKSQQWTWHTPTVFTLTSQLFLIFDKEVKCGANAEGTQTCNAAKLAIGCRDRIRCQEQEGHETDLCSAFLWAWHVQLSEKQLQDPACDPAVPFQSCTQKSTGQTEAQKRQFKTFEHPY